MSTETNKPDALLRLRDVMAIVPFKHAKIYDMTAKGEFPRQFRIGGAAFWSRNEVEAWVAARLSDRDATAA